MKKNIIILSMFIFAFTACSIEERMRYLRMKDAPKINHSVAVLIKEDIIAYKIGNFLDKEVNKNRYMSTGDQIIAMLFRKSDFAAEEDYLNLYRRDMKWNFLKRITKAYFKANEDTILPLNMRIIGLYKNTRNYGGPDKIFLNYYVKHSKNVRLIKNIDEAKESFIAKITFYGWVLRANLNSTSEKEAQDRLTSIFLLEIFDNRGEKPKKILKKLYCHFFTIEVLIRILKIYLVENPYRPFK